MFNLFIDEKSGSPDDNGGLSQLSGSGRGVTSGVFKAGYHSEN
jgi:hypothetical protein